MEQLLSDLKLVREIINERWWQGKFGADREKEGRCLIGAIGEVKNLWDSQGRVRYSKVGNTEIGEYLRKKLLLPEWALWKFNDDEQMTKERMLAFLDVCIKEVEENVDIDYDSFVPKRFYPRYDGDGGTIPKNGANSTR